MNMLKEQIEKDAPIFLNPQEFGEIIYIDGLECLGIWDEDIQATKQFENDIDTMGVFTVSRMLMVAPMYPDVKFPTPVHSQVLDIDGVLWTVKDSTPQDGIIALTIYRNES